jgi:hypothetical protein
MIEKETVIVLYTLVAQIQATFTATPLGVFPYSLFITVKAAVLFSISN